MGTWGCGSTSRTTEATWLTQLFSNKDLKSQPVAGWEVYSFDTLHSPTCSTYLLSWPIYSWRTSYIIFFVELT